MRIGPLKLTSISRVMSWKDYLKGLKEGLGDKTASMIVAEDAYEVAEPTIDSHVGQDEVAKR